MLRWQDLIRYSDEQLAVFDDVEKNLAFAAGLPGSERIDVPFCLETRDQWVRIIKKEEGKLYKRFLRDRDEFRCSWAYARILNMVTILWQDLGANYNREKIAPEADFGLDDYFVHGIFQGPGGTCGTLPVLYVSVGRKLGYPLKFVTARGNRGRASHNHLFCRWDEPGGERFNVEVNYTGLSTPPDDHYRTGIFAETTFCEQQFGLLKSHTPREEIAIYMCQRASEWQRLRCYREAMKCYLWAGVVDRKNQMFMTGYHQHYQKLVEKGKAARLVVRPEFIIDYPPRQWPQLTEEQERDVIKVEVIYDVLTTDDPAIKDLLWNPARRKPPGHKERIAIRYPERKALQQC